MVSCYLLNVINMEQTSIIAAFITGLFAGGLSCMAVQGGLLATSIAQREELKLKEKTKDTQIALPIIMFLFAKVMAYTAMGFLLGWFGSFFQLSLGLRIIMQLLVVVFMLSTALNLLNVHPIFRYVIIQPPRFITKRIRNTAKSRDVFAPAMLGFLTVLIPCGVTQGVMVAAMGTGNPFMGAALLLAFTIGTSPLFFILGYFATKLGEAMHSKFTKIAAVTLVALAIYTLNGTLALTGKEISLTDLGGRIMPSISIGKAPSNTVNNPTIDQRIGDNEVTISINSHGYSPNKITLKSNTKVRINLVNTDAYSCAQAFTIPSLGIQKVVPVGRQEIIEFVTPAMSSEIPFMCSMGMYRGKIYVN